MNRWTLSLIYLSLGFLLVWLVQADYLELPVIRDWPALAASLLFLFLGFLAGVAAWRNQLAQGGVEVSFAEAGASIGLSIFGKYIPGKIWAVMGRAVYLAERKDRSLSLLSVASLNTQILTVWAGLLVGSLTFLAADATNWKNLGWLTLLLWGALSLLILSDSVRHTIKFFLRRIGRDADILPHVSLAHLARAAPRFLLVWLIWAVGFAMLVVSLAAEPPVWAHGFAFALAATLGIAALVAPGGLGVREGLLVLLLVMMGQTSQAAATIAVASRLWFLCGELMVFAAGVACHHQIRKIRLDGSD